MLVEVWFELRHGGTICLPRITQPEPAQAALLAQLGLDPARATAAARLCQGYCGVRVSRDFVWPTCGPPATQVSDLAKLILVTCESRASVDLRISSVNTNIVSRFHRRVRLKLITK